MTDKKSNELLQDWFKTSGLRKKWFAEKIGVCQPTLSNWISGKVHAPAADAHADRSHDRRRCSA
jgi:predicted XRE-type DNA-binding protein